MNSSKGCPAVMVTDELARAVPDVHWASLSPEPELADSTTSTLCEPGARGKLSAFELPSSAGSEPEFTGWPVLVSTLLGHAPSMRR